MLRVGAPPYLRAGRGLSSVTRMFILAAAIVLASGLVLFGWNTIRVLAICVASAVLIDSAARAVLGRSERGAEGTAALVGMLTACTLPPTVYWPVPLLAAALAVLAGLVMTGGLGNYLWHPVALARVVVQILFPAQLTPPHWPVLDKEYLLWGNLSAARPLPPPATWACEPLPYGAQAWEVQRPADVLASAIPVPENASAAKALAALVRDALPPWSHTLTGVAGGAIGEACGLAVILGGLLLLWRGLARWSLPVAGVLAVAILAAILPVTLQPAKGPQQWHWLPGISVYEGLPVGLVYVLYHLTAGELLFVLMLLAADPTSSPLTTRGHALFGALIGGLAVGLRILTGVPAAGYWALLIANTLVPLLDRATRRRVFGT
jgi:electron transport complex protein RnfD